MDGLAGTHNWVVYESWAALDSRDRAQIRHQRWGWDKLVGAAAFLAALSVVSQAWAAPFRSTRRRAMPSTPAGGLARSTASTAGCGAVRLSTPAAAAKTAGCS